MNFFTKQIFTDDLDWIVMEKQPTSVQHTYDLLQNCFCTFENNHHSFET